VGSEPDLSDPNHAAHRSQLQMRMFLTYSRKQFGLATDATIVASSHAPR
jgi:hypothetical protein